MKMRNLLWGAPLAIALAACGTTVTHNVQVPGPTVTVTATPTRTVVKTVVKKVPGPTVYKTVYVPASQGPTGTTIARYSGSGNQNTGTFEAPASGDYVVKWTYSGNFDSFGQGANFIMSNTDQGAENLGLPNDIGGSGSGSTEVTNASGPESFNMEASGYWTVTVISAP